ncbi:aldehyde dehydrogenase family protein [Streptomyces sp. NPDC002092]
MPTVPHARLYIDGQWIDTSEHYEVRNPATQDLVATIAKGSRDHAEQAVAAAKSAFEKGSWRRTPPRERAEILRRVADRLTERSEELVHLQARENGAPVRLAEAFHIGASLAHFHYLADLAARYEPQRPSPLVTPVLAAGVVRREPMGVCVAIVPWNIPLVLAVWKIAPAFAAGNTVVLKPDERAPLVLHELVREFDAAGLPPGVLNFVTGDGPDVGACLAQHPDVRKVAFTGSTPIGREVMRQPAGNIKHLDLELGGKSANIILEDADLATAVDGSVFACFAYSGQACEAGTRLLLPDVLHDEFVDRMIKRVKTLRMGDPLDPETDVGPVISAQHRDHILEHLTQARREGAHVAYGGGVPTAARFKPGHWIEPTILTDVTPTMRIAREEVFGPVLAVMRYRTVDEAIAIANSTPYALSAGIWSRDIQAALDIAEELAAGSVWINDWFVIPPESPFGGCRQSGIGREGGPQAIDAYTEEKFISIDLSGGTEGKLYSLLLGAD